VEIQGWRIDGFLAQPLICKGKGGDRGYGGVIKVQRGGRHKGERP